MKRLPLLFRIVFVLLICGTCYSIADLFLSSQTRNVFVSIGIGGAKPAEPPISSSTQVSDAASLPTEAPTLSEAPTLTPTLTETPTLTPTLTETPTLTPTLSETPTLTPIPMTETPTLTPILTGTPTLTLTPTETLISTACPGTLEKISLHDSPTHASPNKSILPQTVTYLGKLNQGVIPDGRSEWWAVEVTDSVNYSYKGFITNISGQTFPECASTTVVDIPTVHRSLDTYPTFLANELYSPSLLDNNSGGHLFTKDDLASEKGWLFETAFFVSTHTTGAFVDFTLTDVSGKTVTIKLQSTDPSPCILAITSTDSSVDTNPNLTLNHCSNTNPWSQAPENFMQITYSPPSSDEASNGTVELRFSQEDKDNRNISLPPVTQTWKMSPSSIRYEVSSNMYGYILFTNLMQAN